MKKLLMTLPLALTLTACVTADGTLDPRTTAATNAGVSVFKVAVDQKCRTELNTRREWKVLSAAVGSDKKQELENNICGCVSEESVNNVSIVEMGQAAIDPKARTTIISRAVANTLGTCISKFKI
jgi:hypothetical protein